jgi:2-isopropylmalate synthase
MAHETIDSDRVRFFDTTLRDGEQSPGATMTQEEKLRLAGQLGRLGVDIIEAGFAIASQGDFEAIRTIAGEVEGPVICSLARAKEQDIRRAHEAVKDAPRHRIHTFHSSSDIHLKYQYRIDRAEALKRSVEMVKLARSLVEDVEFSPMDATRTEMGYLAEMVEAVVEAGASTVNIPDTVGYTTPDEFGRMIAALHGSVGDRAIISVHCHNDLGLAVANSLAAVLNGARQVECTINGIGERAGNCSLEEVAMAIWTRKDYYKVMSGIVTEQITPSSRMVTQITGMSVQPNKAIVGANAFAHEAGIHQDGLLKERTTYEIISPEVVGLKHSAKLVLGKHSGRHAFRSRIEELGYKLDDDAVEDAFAKFKDLADRKKEVYDEDIVAIVFSGTQKTPEHYSLEDLEIHCGMDRERTARIRISVGGESREVTTKGDGPVDAAYRAIAELTGTRSELQRFDVKGITEGMDAQGEVTVTLEEDGRTVRGYGTNTDILVAAALAYLNALNKLVARSTDSLSP